MDGLRNSLRIAGVLLLLGAAAWVAASAWRVAAAAVTASAAAPAGADSASSAPAAGLRIWIGGDVQPGAGHRDILAPLAPLIDGARGIVNLEGPVGAAGSGSVVNERSALDRLKSAGVCVAGIANNHRDDLGATGIRNTIAALREATILPAGEPAGPALLTDAGLTLVVSAHDLGKGVPDSLGMVLARDRRRGDALVVLFHATGPASYLPRKELKAAVEIAVQAGAAVIAAQGTHAVGPIERRGAVVIAWGLGNLAFACDCTRESDALILMATLTREGCVEATIVPIDAGLQGEPARPARDREGILDLLQAIGSSTFRRAGDRALLQRPAGAPE